jgi:hypothetical protein
MAFTVLAAFAISICFGVVLVYFLAPALLLFVGFTDIFMSLLNHSDISDIGNGILRQFYFISLLIVLATGAVGTGFFLLCQYILSFF